MPVIKPAALRPMVEDKNVLAIFRSGSRVYGCHSPSSDEDFLAVIAKGNRDLIRRPGVNVVVQTADQFQQALREHSMLALECFFAPPETRLKDAAKFEFKLDRRVLAAKVTETSDSDFKKAGKRWADDLPGSKKKLYHSIRVLTFALQVAAEGRITDFGAANMVWAAIHDNESDAWEDYASHVQTWHSLRDALQK